MRLLYCDCFSGISGDMCLSALLDLGVPLQLFQDVAAQLALPMELTTRQVQKQSIRATQVVITELAPQPQHRSLAEMQQILHQGKLPQMIREKVEQSLLRLAEAEASAHGVAPEKVHFHEVGGLDTLIDLAGTYTAVDYLGVKQVIVSPLPLGRGGIQTAHGLIPLPAPATLHLLCGVPTCGVDLEAELVTPTGAVLSTTLASSFGPPPSANWEKIGYGAGMRDLPHPNVLRLWLGESLPASNQITTTSYDYDQVLVLETQVDDGNPEFLPYLRERLTKAGALDVTFTPVLMKKGRPGTTVTVLTSEQRLQTMAGIVFRESTAIGLRWYQANRIKLFRKDLRVETQYGQISVKIGFALRPDGSQEVCNLAPEYEDCARCATASGAGIKEVYQTAQTTARQLFNVPS